MLLQKSFFKLVLKYGECSNELRVTLKCSLLLQQLHMLPSIRILVHVLLLALMDKVASMWQALLNYPTY